MTRPFQTLSVSIALAFSFFLAPVESHRASAADQPTAAQLKHFEQHIRPLLLEQCLKCHGAKEQKSGLRLDSRAGMLKGGESGPAIVPGKPDESMLIEAVRYESYEMPPDGQLKDDQIAALVKWIEMGAPWPDAEATLHDGRKITAEDREFWSFQPVAKVEPPEVDDGGWSQNEIDRFIFRKLQKAGLKPAPPAERRDLVRRAYFDLIGLPPTPEEIEAFLADESPQAFEHLVDRLLDSPRYGEHWGRHWLDLVRYAESDGFRADAYRPHAWRYRDYVIRAFNDDKSFNEFAAEQLAGDEIAPHDADALVATGFLRHYIYEYNQRDARTQRQDILNDVTEVTGDVFLGMGMGCARCHDHKFDPLLQEDYFRLQAFFVNMLPRDDVPAASAEQRAEHQRQIDAWEAKTADLRRQIDEMENPYLEKAARAAITKFPKDIQAIMAVPKVERSAIEMQLADLVNRQVLFEEERLKYKDEDKKRLDELKAQLAEFDGDKPKPLPAAYTVTDTGPTAPVVLIPDDESERPIPPGFLSVFDPQPATISPMPPSAESTGRRSTLARWITDSDNPLTTRVIVNRIWQYHFGQGLVRTPSDFGHLGEPPSHPELLDWLTRWFIDHGWSQKELHRLIMASAVYQQSAQHPEQQRAEGIDPQNRLRWRSNVRRLQAEQIRDAMLAVAGQLDLKAGGPSVGANTPRRSVYTKVIRNTPDPLLKSFDVADGFNSTARRNVTTTANQALLMINGEWTLARAKTFAERLSKARGDDADGLVEAAYRWAYGREPTGEERSAAVEFLRVQGDRSANPRSELEKSLTAAMQGREGVAAVVRDGGPLLTAPFRESLPAGDFTVEAVFQLNSLYPDATVRTIVSHWDSDTSHPGWAFGVTSTKSAHQPRNLILQLVGDADYEVVASNLRPELNKPYYAAVSVRIGEKGKVGVTFYLKDLSKPDAPLETAQVAHKVTGEYRPNVDLVIGGRHGQTRHKWDGLLDDVRITTAALGEKELLLHDGKPNNIVGHWQFEAEPGFEKDASTAGNHLAASPAAANDPDRQAMIDFCHVLLNSNEFLYVD